MHSGHSSMTSESSFQSFAHCMKNVITKWWKSVAKNIIDLTNLSSFELHPWKIKSPAKPSCSEIVFLVTELHTFDSRLSVEAHRSGSNWGQLESASLPPPNEASCTVSLRPRRIQRCESDRFCFCITQGFQNHRSMACPATDRAWTRPSCKTWSWARCLSGCDWYYRSSPPR